MGPGAFGAEPVRVVPGGDQQAGCSIDTDPVELEQRWSHRGDELAQHGVESIDLVGSEFTPARVSGPVSFPWGAVTVLFRPFPNEADTSFQLATSIEGAALIALAALSWSRLRSVPGSFLRSPYDRFVVVYTVGFIIAFSVLANFGILARQRAQLWPIVLVLYALPVKKPALGLVPDAARLISVRQPAESAS